MSISAETASRGLCPEDYGPRARRVPARLRFVEITPGPDEKWIGRRRIYAWRDRQAVEIERGLQLATLEDLIDSVLQTGVQTAVYLESRVKFLLSLGVAALQ
jgi:hypothetical protein